MNIPELLIRCYDLARKSPDPSNQNGAIIIENVPEGNQKLYNAEYQIISEGMNDIVRGIRYSKEQMMDREWKLSYIEHAERAVIYGMCCEGIYDPVMICPWLACTDCARAIVLSGIGKVISHQERMDMTPDRWKNSMKIGHEILRKGGVAIELYSGKLKCDPIIVNGKLWYP